MQSSSSAVVSLSHFANEVSKAIDGPLRDNVKLYLSSTPTRPEAVADVIFQVSKNGSMYDLSLIVHDIPLLPQLAKSAETFLGHQTYTKYHAESILVHGLTAKHEKSHHKLELSASSSEPPSSQSHKHVLQTTESWLSSHDDDGHTFQFKINTSDRKQLKAAIRHAFHIIFMFGLTLRTYHVSFYVDDHCLYDSQLTVQSHGDLLNLEIGDGVSKAFGEDEQTLFPPDVPDSHHHLIRRALSPNGNVFGDRMPSKEEATAFVQACGKKGI